MDIVTNIKQITFNKSWILPTFDYVETFFREYFCYSDERDILVSLNKCESQDDYSLMLRYIELIKDSPCLYSWFPKMYELFYKKTVSKRYHTHPKSLLYSNLWCQIGMYISNSCKSRFVFKFYNEIAFFKQLVIQNENLEPYKYSFKNILDYLECSINSPIVNIYEFSNGESSIFRYAIETVELTLPLYISSVNLYNYKHMFLNSINSVSTSENNRKFLIPAGVLYKFVIK